MIDLHCHLLPGVDDGPRTLRDALELARQAVGAGTGTIVATPHIDTHHRLDPTTVAGRVETLQRELDRHDIPLLLRTGGEIALPRLPELGPEALDAVRLGGGPYLLLECPLEQVSWDFDAVLLQLHERGESIVMAHPERCPLFQREPDRLEALVDAGLLSSITAGSIVGQFGERVRRFSLELLRAGLVHDVASDAHDAHRRPAGIGRAFLEAETEIPGIATQAGWLIELMPRAILAGAPLPPRP